MGFIAAALELRADKLAPRGISRLDDPRYIFGTSIGDDHTGLDLSESEVVGWPAMLQALRIIGWSLGQMPLQVYEREAQGARKLKAADGHPLQRILQEKPHDEYTPFEIKEGIGVNAAFRGDSYHQVLRTTSGAVAGLFPLDSNRMRVERRNGQRWYIYSDGGADVYMRPGEVLHVAGLSDGGLMGFAIQKISATSLAKGVAMDRFGAKTFKNGASGNPIVESTQPYKWKDAAAEKEFYDKLADKIAGQDNWHKIAGLPYGFTIKTLGITAREAQLIEGLVYQVQDIARLTGVPPSLLMDNSHNTFTNSEQQFLQFIKMGLGGWIVKIEERMRLTLLSDAERGRYTIKFNADALLRTSLKERYESYRIACGVPFMSRNEARDLEDMEPIEGGDVIPEPLNMGNPGGDPALSDTPPVDGDSDTRAAERRDATPAERRAEVRARIRERQALRRAYRRQITQDAQRLVRAELREVRNALDKTLGERDATDFESAIKRYYEDGGYRTAAERAIVGTLENYAREVAAAAASEIGQDAPDVDAFIRAYVDGFINRSSSSHLNQLLALLRADAENAADAIAQRLDEWEEREAEKVGNNESVRLGEAVARAAFVAVGVTTFMWSANDGACPICEEMDGRVVGSERVFVESSETVDPNDDDATPLESKADILHPPLHQGCECSIVTA